MKRKLIALGLLVLALLLASCALQGESGGDESKETTKETTDPDAVPEKYNGLFTNRDLSGYIPDDEDVTYIDFSENGTEIKGLGASVEYDGDEIFIKDGGVYILSGKYNGQIHVDSDKLAKIQLVLNGVDIYCERNSPIYIGEADKVFVTLAENTENKLSDGFFYAVFNDDSGCDATLFSRSDLVVNGKGKLNIESEFKHGIVSKDDLKICGCDITVSCPGSGIVGKDSVRIADATLGITAGSDGIKSDNDIDETRGYVTVFDSEIRIKAGKDGVQAETAVTLNGGRISISATENAFNFAADNIGNNGSEIIATGMAVSPVGITSTLPALSFSLPIEEGDRITVRDGENEMASFTAECSGSNVYVSLNGLEKGKDYILSVNSKEYDVKPE